MLKKSLHIITVFLLCCFVTACTGMPDTGDTNPSDTALVSRVRIAPVPENVPEFSGAEVYIKDSRVPLYSVKTNYSQTWNPNPDTRQDSGFGYFELEGKADIAVKLPYAIDYSSKVRPISAGIIPVADIENNILKFTVVSAGTYIIEPNNDKNKAIVLFVSEFSEYLAQDFSAYDTVIYFEKGLHDRTNSEYIDNNNAVSVLSNTLVYIDRGAVVRAKFLADNADNIAITGGGIIDGSAFERNAAAGTRTIPIDINNCTNVVLKDFSCLDPAGWCINSYFNSSVLIDGIKIVTSRSNGDGISLQSNKDVVVKNCFVRSWDDSLVVKNYPMWSNRNIEGASKNILFENCLLWTDLAQSLELGYETVGEEFSNIVFRDITIAHALHKPPISIHNGNNADITGVIYENITVEDASMGGGDAGSNNQLIELSVAWSSNWSNQHKVTALGSISGISFDNITVLSAKTGLNLRIGISGCVDTRAAYSGAISKISGISLNNITLFPESTAKRVDIISGYTHFTANQYVSGVTFSHDGQPATGAAFKFSASEAKLSEYGNNVSVEIG